MSTVTNFLKLSPTETVLDEWEILNDSGDFRLGDIACTLLFLGLLLLLVLSTVMPYWWIPVPMARGLIVIAMIFLAMLIPAELFKLISTPKRSGHLCMTNWRCIYIEQGQGRLRNYYRVFSTDLKDIVAVHTSYETNCFNVQSMLYVIHTKFEDTMRIHVGETGRLLSRIPVVGRLFRRQSLGRDAFAVPSILFDRIQQRMTALVDSASSY